MVAGERYTGGTDMCFHGLVGFKNHEWCGQWVASPVLCFSIFYTFIILFLIENISTVLSKILTESIFSC